MRSDPLITLEFLCAESKKQEVDLAEFLLDWQSKEMDCSIDRLKGKLAKSLAVMREAILEGLASTSSSRTGLSGGDARRMNNAGPGVMGNLAHRATVYAVATAEVNAAMGRIVAAPTAGASGVVPGVLLAAADELEIDQEQLVRGLAVAGGIGLVIAEHATLAGAEGGCQAECGSAAAMAAGALVYLRGGSSEMVMHAAALALKNQIGLVCDPVAGLVEVPCVKRNAGSAVIALLACDMALSGVQSFIPPDEVIEAVAEVGKMLPPQLKETGQGGLANTRTARTVENSLFGK